MRRVHRVRRVDVVSEPVAVRPFPRRHAEVRASGFPLHRAVWSMIHVVIAYTNLFPICLAVGDELLNCIFRRHGFVRASVTRTLRADDLSMLISGYLPHRKPMFDLVFRPPFGKPFIHDVFGDLPPAYAILFFSHVGVTCFRMDFGSILAVASPA